MGKSRYGKRYPRAIVQSRKDHPSTLYATIPQRIVQAMNLNEGDVVEWVFVTEGFDKYVKMRVVRED